MFDCPNCSKKTYKLIAPSDPQYTTLVCPFCYEAKKNPRDPQLHQKNGEWGIMSKGKAWEIDNRVRSKDDPKVWINKTTGKPTQY